MPDTEFSELPREALTAFSSFGHCSPSGDKPIVPVRRCRLALKCFKLGSAQLLLAVLTFLSPSTHGRAEAQQIPDVEHELTLQVNAGGVTFLGPGTYVVRESWLLDRDLTLIGAGKEATLLLFEETNDDTHSAITWRGEGRLTFNQIHLEYMGQDPATVLSAEAGIINLVDVVITGGWAGDSVSAVGSGLELTGRAQARVFRGFIHGNDSHGVTVRGDARLSLVASEIADNAWSGIAVSDRGHATLNDAMVRQNRDHGIGIWGDAYAEITATVTRDTGWSGGAVSDQAVARLASVVSAANGDHGVAIWGSASAQIEAAYVYENLWSGVAAYGQSFVRVTGSIASANLESGILVFGKAEALATFNDLTGNKGAGLTLAQNAYGALIRNRIESNGGPGVECLGEAYGYFAINTVNMNQGEDVTWGGETKCAGSRPRSP